MFVCYSLLDPTEWGGAIFWDWFPTKWLKDPSITSLSSHTLIFWEIDFSNYVKNCKNLVKNHQEF
jgi:hypothetical protein